MSILGLKFSVFGVDSFVGDFSYGLNEWNLMKVFCLREKLNSFICLRLCTTNSNWYVSCDDDDDDGDNDDNDDDGDDDHDDDDNDTDDDCDDDDDDDDEWWSWWWWWWGWW